ncbi:MAG TPA: RNA-binding cell elongation regulator Jag/EloR [bacterium]|nr:RNA-binding cell elongation regulator Jag/EloR [bacterium]
MSSAEASARSVEEAIALAIRELGASREDVDVEVLQEPRPALLGLGGRDARVRVTTRSTEGALAERIATEVLGLMGYTATGDIQESGGRTTVVLEGQEIGGLVGPRGQTLDALEFLVGLQLAKRLGHRLHVTLDAEGYRARRETALQAMAGQAANRAIRERKPVSLEPMDPRDRRTIHMALQHDPRVVTSSIGEDENRRVVVHPRDGGDVLPNDGLPREEDLEQ